MTNQPGRVRIQQDADSERSWGFRTDARLQWMMTNLASLDAPVWQVMMVLIKYADEAGRTFPAVRTIGDSLDLDPVDVEVALADAEALDLIRPDGLSEYGTPAWMLQEGQRLPDPLPLFTKVVTNKVRDLLRYIGPIEYILLEAMIDIGYKWMDNTIHTTSRQLRERLPGLDESQLRDGLHRLCATPYVTRLKRGRLDRPSIFQLELSAVAEAAHSRHASKRRISHRAENLGPEKLCGNNKAVAKISDGDDNTGREKLSGDNTVDGEKLSPDNFSGAPPIKEPTTVKPTIDKSSSSSQLNAILRSDDDDDKTDRERFLSTLTHNFRETIPGAPGIWRRSYAKSALTIAQPYCDHFGHYPPDSDIVDLLARCAAYAARTWAYIAQTLSEWVDEQVSACAPLAAVSPGQPRAGAATSPDERAVRLWEDALKIIRPSVTRPLYDTCLSRTTGLSWAEGVFTIEVPNQAAGALIEDRLYTMVVGALQDLLESPLALAIESPITDQAD